MPLRHDVSAPSKVTSHPLDSVIWTALNGTQRSFSVGNDRARRYLAAVAPFAATIDLTHASLSALFALVGSADDRVALVTPATIHPPPQFSVVRRELVDQMVLLGPVATDRPLVLTAIELGAADALEMLALARVAQPGPFGPRTVELGRYLGVRRRGALIAMAGERIRLEGFTEISAVCVEPAYRGKGFAAGLVASLAANIVARSEIPFLHVFNSNQRAAALYRSLGFALRRQVHLTVLGRAPGEQAAELPHHVEN